MKHKIRKSYNVMGSKIKIKIVERMSELGLYDNQNNIIYLNKNQTDEELLKTLLHELIHALQFKSGIHQAVSGELLEVMAETGSVLFFELFLKTPKKPRGM